MQGITTAQRRPFELLQPLASLEIVRAPRLKQAEPLLPETLKFGMNGQAALGRELTASQATALKRAGTPIGANELWIACHALAEGATVVDQQPEGVAAHCRLALGELGFEKQVHQAPIIWATS